MELCRKRYKSFPVSKMWQWWVSLSSSAVVKSLSDDVIRVVEMDPQQMLVSVPILGTRLCVLSRCWPEPGGGPTVSQAIRLSRIPLIAES